MGGHVREPIHEGEVYGLHHKMVEHVVYDAPLFVVYLDDDFYVWWAEFSGYWKDGQTAPASQWYGEAVNRVGTLESIPLERLTPEVRRAFKQMVATGLARALDERNLTNANIAFAEAERFIVARRTERARASYLISASWVALLLAGAGLTLWLLRDALAPSCTEPVLLSLIGAAVGCLGAFLSVLHRFSRLRIDPDTSDYGHRAAGAARLLAGGIAAGIASAAMFGDVLLGFADPGSNPAVCMLGCAVAGFSERMIPNLLQQLGQREKINDEQVKHGATVQGSV